MCGIVGIIGKKPLKENLFKMLDSQKHRGPDYTGHFFDKDVVLGHNRLSIIDLSSEANQPFIDENNRFQLVFNGEIYNYLELKEELASKYTFKTNSDTEVLLASYIIYGKDCLHKLNGMFSFAIWDSEKKELFAARDRFGVKPFYYHQDKDTFYFSSEIKAIFSAGIKKKPNKKVWANYFCFGSYGLPNETFYDNIEQLPASHFLTLNNNKLEITKWYHFEREVEIHQEKLSYQEVKEKYTELLKDAIKLRFRSDVAVGFNISGGLDSSALLSFVNQSEDKQHIKAYSFYTNDERYDELPWVEKMISHTNNPLEKVLFSSDEVSKFSNLISYHQDEPFGGIPTLAYAKVFQQARKDNVLVLLDGQGMDEQWAGYDYYTQQNENTIQGVKSNPFKKDALSKKLLQLAEKPIYPKPFKDDLLNKQYRDLFYTKIPRALRFNDRVSMAFSTELREPFLDYRLVELAFSQPLEYKIKNGIQKKILREIVSEYLSKDISYAPKRPLQTPQREWLGNELESFVVDNLNTLKESKYKDWFNFTEVDTLWKSYKDGDNQTSFHIWQWINFSMLLKNE